MKLRFSNTNRLLLLSGAGWLALASGGIAEARESALPEADAAAEAPADAADAGDYIVVTGSRVARTDGMETPLPVVNVEAAEIETLSPGSLVTGLSQLPQFYGNETPAAVPPVAR